nr:MAG TPA: Pilus assembly protein TadZ N-terminal [Microviridae sp.]
MKALLISESDEILNSYAAFFKKAGYDTVCYRWLLKAMDNLEEIEPLVVFIDGFGYPRHWKTLAQYIKTSFKNAPLVLLAADLSDEETKKADCLDVHCIRGSIDDEQTRRNILSLLHPEQEPEISAEPVEEIEESEVPAAEPIQTAEPAELAEQPETFVAALEISEPSEESANPEPTTAPALNGGESVSARAEELAECGAAPEQPEVEPAEQSAELIAATEPARIAESVESEGLVEPADFSEPRETAESKTFTAEPEMSDPPFFPVITELGEKPEVPAEPVEEFEEREQIDDEPFFSAPAQTSLSRGESVSAAQNEEPEVPAEPVEQFEKPAVQEEKSEADVLDERNGENEPEAASGDNEVFSFTFFHPRTKTAIYGSTVSFKPPLLYFKPDDSSVLRTLRFGQKSSGVISDKGLASDVSVQIQGFENDSIELCLLK